RERRWDGAEAVDNETRNGRERNFDHDGRLTIPSRAQAREPFSIEKASMKVLYVAYPLLTVSEESAGGAEQMLWTLEREMAERGVSTTVAASAGSLVAGALFATGGPCSQPDDFDRRNREHQDQ